MYSSGCLQEEFVRIKGGSGLKNLFNYLWEHFSRIICRLCGLVWGTMGLVCLFAAYRVWNYLSELQAFQLVGRGTQIAAVTILLMIGILFCIYAVVQFTWERETALAAFFNKKIPNLVMVVLTYFVFIFILCFLTIGEISLKTRYAVPVLIAGIVLLILDLCTNLGLFPDQWDKSSLIRRIRRRDKKQ